MSTLSDWITVSRDEKPFVHFESSLDNPKVVSGYVPVKSTLEVFDFLKQATELTTSQPRAVICHGAYGSGKSRLCTVVARLFRDGFDAPELQAVWERLRARGEGHYIDELKHSMLPGGGSWRPWLVVPMYEQAGGGTISSALIRALVLALRRAGLDDALLGKTIFHAAARRLEEMIASGATYTAPEGSPYTTPQQLIRALEEDLDEEALTAFRSFHKAVTHGVEFKDFLQSTREAALEAHEVYEAVAKNIRQHSFDGIIVIWDEFGFAIEELLRDEQRGVRSLGQEVMRLQTFLESACGSHDVTKRVVFLGFTHISLPEYGTRANLGHTEQNRLNTVSDRFRNPAINIRLSITETEGYHLLAGMIQRTESGKATLESHPPRLVAQSDRMPHYNLWSRFSTQDCYKDIVAPCYPLQPATATALLLLSDQIAQINRTSFYYLQSRQDGGFAGELERREAPGYEDIGSAELMRVHDMFLFFKQSISERRKHLFEQYEDAEARFPDANEFDLAVLRTVLILSVVANRDMAPTTSFLSFCLCDAGRDEPAARQLHEALDRLSAAGCLWKNESTEVWGFGAGRGIASDIEKAIDEQKALIPTLPPAELLSRYRAVQDELADYLGEIDLDPADSGVVRRVGVRFLPGSADDKSLEVVNPALQNPEVCWRAALVYLVAADTPEQLDKWRSLVNSLGKPNYYLVLPPQPGSVGADVHDLIAVHELLGKQTPGTNAYEVLESRLTRLRQKLRRQFEESFGNAGLRAGTSILRSGPTPTRIEITAWNDLLPAIARDLATQFPQQIRVRCGTFNEWQPKLTSAKIGEIVSRILNFDDNPLVWHDQYLGFNETSQEAAIVDGVLIENGFLKQHPISQKWELIEVDKDVSCDALKDVFHHFTTGGGAEKDFDKLFEKLIEPPFGVPNGIVPLLIALVLRKEMERVALYERKGSQSSRVETSGLPDAIVRMGRYPVRFQSRYTRLSGPQRVVYKIIGPHVGVPFLERNSTGEAFYQYCEQVRTELKKWASALPDGILQFTGLSEVQRKLLRMLRAVVPPHIVPLADALVELVKEDAAAGEEIRSTDNKDFPAVQKVWLDFCTKINRHVEGMKAPVRMRLRELVNSKPGVTAVDAGEVASALSFTEKLPPGDNPLKQVYDRVKEAPHGADVTDIVASAISGKPVTSLTDEDYGRADGVLRMTSLVKPDTSNYMLVTPSGERRSLPTVENPSASRAITEDLLRSLQTFGLTRDELLSLAVSALMVIPDPPPRQDSADAVSDSPQPTTAAAAGLSPSTEG